MTTVDVVIPALDEAAALPHVLAEIPRALVRRVVVADNGSRDRAAAVAREVLERDVRGSTEPSADGVYCALRCPLDAEIVSLHGLETDVLRLLC